MSRLRYKKAQVATTKARRVGHGLCRSPGFSLGQPSPAQPGLPMDGEALPICLQVTQTVLWFVLNSPSSPCPEFEPRDSPRTTPPIKHPALVCRCPIP
ncbi:hypothetical protein N7466_001190 [Penicillium verhagenii]|uniref:uncharacterized protein n=1 Tax=Penicillium verhagenii TaxID=1562060 RepID=UPI002544DCB0|nr:uncharacterized protein N7466_001190 [Penicillium verhagenii]KAJ5948175.1 hypothetical protein N7466_001190 [Penicillium verhagenii]